VRHVHSSGRYDRPLVELGRALDAYSDVVDAELVTLTEQDGTDRAREALYTAHGWAWFRAARRGAGECAILWSHADLYPIGEPRSIRLTALTYKRVTGRPAAPVHAATAALRPRFLGPTVLVSVAHLPVRNTPLRRRVIDGAWSSLPVARAHVVDDDESSDHRPFLTTSPPAR
jgi:hypothetical protein